MMTDIRELPLSAIVSEIVQRINDNPDLALAPALQNLESTLRIFAQDAHLSGLGAP